MHAKEDTLLFRKNALDAIIRQELIREKAIALGLNADLGYQAKLDEMRAQQSNFERNELNEVFFRQEIAGKVNVTDADARKYFDENAARIQTELHVWQILRVGDEASLASELADLQKGASFEDVARKQFPKLPDGAQKPWDLGYLKWTQVPESWRPVVAALKPGDVSGLIRGKKGRFWIIKLVDRRVNPEITFESVKAAVVEDMKNTRIEELREKVEKELLEKATITYPKE